MILMDRAEAAQCNRFSNKKHLLSGGLFRRHESIGKWRAGDYYDKCYIGSHRQVQTEGSEETSNKCDSLDSRNQIK